MVMQYIVNDLIFCKLFDSTLMKELLVGSERGKIKVVVVLVQRESVGKGRGGRCAYLSWKADLMWFEELWWWFGVVWLRFGVAWWRFVVVWWMFGVVWNVLGWFGVFQGTITIVNGKETL